MGLRGPEGASTRPLIALRESLERSRAAGLSFEQAWASATRDLTAVEFVDAVDATRAAWRSAYEGQPVQCPFSLLRASRG